MLWDFNLFLLAGMSPDALGNWIAFWSLLPIALIIGFVVVNDWFTQKLKERRKAAEEAKVEGQEDSKETKNEFSLEDYAEITEVPDSIQIFIARGDNANMP